MTEARVIDLAHQLLVDGVTDNEPDAFLASVYILAAQQCRPNAGEREGVLRRHTTRADLPAYGRPPVNDDP